MTDLVRTQLRAGALWITIDRPAKRNAMNAEVLRGLEAALAEPPSAARERGVKLKPRLLALIERQYDAILAQGMAFHAAQPALAKHQARGRPPRRVGHQPAAAPRQPKAGRPALSHRPARAVHQ